MSTAGSWWLCVATPFSSVRVPFPGTTGHLEIGRGPRITPELRLEHKYISRLHLTCDVVSSAAGEERVEVRVVGRNPVLHGSPVRLIAPDGPAVVISRDVATAAAVELSHCTAQDRHTSATFFFPPELGLPSLHVLTSTPEGPSVDRPPAVPVAAMLSVPTACDEDPDQNEAPSMPPQLHLLQKAMAEHCDAVTALRKREREEDSFRSPNDSLVGDNDLAAAVAPPRAAPTSEGRSKASPPPMPAIVDKESPLPNAGSRAPHNAPCTAAGRRVDPTAAAKATPWWEWKSISSGDAKDPKSWRRYPRVVAEALEQAFRAGITSTVPIDDVYAVCFDDANVGMVQYRRDDPTRWRPVRRRGGEPEPHNMRRQHISRVGPHT